MAYDPKSGDVFTASESGGGGGIGSVFVVNTTKEALVQTFSIGSQPCAMAYDSASDTMYVGDLSASYVYSVDASTGAVLSSIPVPSYVNALTYDPVQGVVFATLGISTLAVINTTTNTVSKTLSGVTNNPHGVIYDPSNGFVYVANKANGSVTVINATTDVVVAWLSAGSSPDWFAYDETDQTVYLTVPNSGIDQIRGTSLVTLPTTFTQPGPIVWDSLSNELYYAPYSSAPGGEALAVFNATSDQSTSVLNFWGNYPYSLAFDPWNHEVYEYSGGADQINVISTALDVGTPRIINDGVPSFGTLSQNITGLSTPYSLTYDADSNSMVVTDDGSNSLSVINPLTGRLVMSPSVGSSPDGVAYYAPFEELFTANSGSSSYSITAAATGTLLQTGATWSNPHPALYDPLNGNVYVADNYNVSVVSGNTGFRSAVIQDGSPDPNGEALDPNTGYLYISSCLVSGTVSVINTLTQTLVTSLSAGSCPSAVAFDPANGNIYVTDEALDHVSVFSGANDSLLKVISVGSKPLGIGYDPLNDYLYVPDSGSGNISVINGSQESVVASIPLGGTPRSVGFAGINGDMYVSNPSLGSVQILTTQTGLRNASSDTVDVGRALLVTAPMVSEGTGDIRQTISVQPSTGLACQAEPSGHYILSASCFGESPGSYLVTFLVNDSSTTVTTNLTVTVAALPSEGPIVATPPSSDAGQASVVFRAAPRNGTPPYTFSWIAPATLGCSPSLSNLLDCTPNATGNFSVSVGFTDSDGLSSGNVTSVYSVWSLPKVTLIESATAIDLGQSFNLTASASLGAPGGYNFTYSGLPTGCASANRSFITCAPTATGNYTGIQVTVMDANGGSARSNPLNLTVNPSLRILFFTAAPANVSVGKSTLLAISPTGGQIPYSYSYLGLPPGCTSQDTALLNCTPASTGTFNISVVLRDSVGGSTSDYTHLSVYSAPTITAFTASPNPISVGNPVSLSTKVIGGTRPYTFSYGGLPLGCTSVDNANLTCTPQSAGNFSITVLVTDALGLGANRQLSLSVTPEIGGPLVTHFTVSPNPVNEGNAVTFNTTVSGGKAPLAFLYNGLPPGCPFANTSSLICTPTSPGNFTVSVQVTDALGRVATSTTPLEVVPIGKVLPPTVTLTASNVSIYSGNVVTFIASVHGGFGPFHYVWSLNGTNVSGDPNASDLTTRLAHPGTYTFRVWVTDARGAIAGSNAVNVAVTLPSSSSSSSVPSAFNIWLLIIVAALGVIALILFLWTRSRRGSGTERTTVRSGDSLTSAPSVVNPATSPLATTASPQTSTGTSEEAPTMDAAGAVSAPSAAPLPAVDPAEEERRKRRSAIGLTECPLCRVSLKADMTCPQCGMDWSPKDASPTVVGSSPPTVPQTTERTPEDIEDELRRADLRLKNGKAKE